MIVGTSCCGPNTRTISIGYKMNMSRKRDLLRMVLAISTLQPTNRLYTNCVLVSFDTRVLIINYMDFVLFFFNLLPPAYAELLSMLSDDVCHLFHLSVLGIMFKIVVTVLLRLYVHRKECFRRVKGSSRYINFLIYLYFGFVKVL
jgi:hypothetical protein